MEARAEKTENRLASVQGILNKVIPFLGLAIMIVVFELMSNGKLLTAGNIRSILNQSVYVAIMAFGAVFVYAHGGMDLSYGSVIGFSVLIGVLVGRAGAPFPAIVAANILAAVAWFALNGLVSVYLKVSPFITSLCIMYMCRGILNTVCAKEKYSVPVYIYNYDNWTLKITLLVVAFIVCYLLFEKSWIGKANKAIGGNPLAAQQAGVNVARTRMIAYLISGVTPDRSTAKVWIVHRLDKGTSGAVVFAKDERAKDLLQSKWKELVAERRYVAWLEGKVEKDAGAIQSWLLESPKSLKMKSFDTEVKDGQLAITHYKVLQRTKYYSEVEFELETGRKNQIRVHAAELGHPVAGDDKYGAQTNPIKRLALHAHTLVFRNPYSQKMVRCTSPLPDSFARFVK